MKLDKLTSVLRALSIVSVEVSRKVLYHSPGRPWVLCSYFNDKFSSNTEFDLAISLGLSSNRTVETATAASDPVFGNQVC